jgi:hypothetical protein
MAWKIRNWSTSHNWKRDILYENNMDATNRRKEKNPKKKTKHHAPESQPALPLYIKIITLSTK